MLHVGHAPLRTCQGVSRREMLQVAGLGVVDLSLADWFRSQARAAPGDRGRARDVACIFLWLDGGPSHLETFDPKPDAPDNVRGPYGTIRSNVPGLHVGELLPM